MAIRLFRTIDLFTLLIFLAGLTAAQAAEEVRLFVVEKSKNPQNILVVYAQASRGCRVNPIGTAAKSHLFDFYWLMNGTTYKPTHPLIKRHARKRFIPEKLYADQTRFTVKLADLKELDHDLPGDIVTITLIPHPSGKCMAKALLPLGPSAHYRTMHIRSIYSKARTLMGIPIGIYYIELRGLDAETQKEITVRFNSKADAYDGRETVDVQKQ
jgi:hypothetical protein